MIGKSMPNSKKRMDFLIFLFSILPINFCHNIYAIMAGRKGNEKEVKTSNNFRSNGKLEMNFINSKSPLNR